MEDQIIMKEVESISKERIKELLTIGGFNDVTDKLTLDAIIEALCYIAVTAQNNYERAKNEVFRLHEDIRDYEALIEKFDTNMN